MMICAEKPGGPEVLDWREADAVIPNSHEVLIRQTKIGLNFLDIYMTSGTYPFPKDELFIPGCEAAGEVLECGNDVSSLKTGDRVAYVLPGGAYREERVVPAEKLVKLPDSISDEVAAASMLKGMTVEYLVNRSAHLNSGDIVLFHAAAGGVGLIAGQWLQSMGVTVIGTVGSSEKEELARSSGYDHVINYSKDDFVDAVMEITNGKGVKVVYDSVGQATYPDSLRCLQRFGLFVSFGQSSGLINNFKVSDLAGNGSLYTQRPTLFNYISTVADLADVSGHLFNMLSAGKVKLFINQRFPLADAAMAFKQLTERKTTGITIFETGK